MSVGSLVPLVLFGTTVLLALEPIRRPRGLAVASFLAALGAGELPQLFLVLLLAATVPDLVESGLPHEPAGWLPLGLVALTCAGLGLVAVRAARARDVVGRALVEGLGNAVGYRRPGPGTGVMQPLLRDPVPAPAGRRGIPRRRRPQPTEEELVQFSRMATALATDDVAASRDFYVDHFGFTPAVDLGWYVSLHHPDHPEQVLDLVARDHPSIPARFRGHRVGGTTLALLVADAAREEGRLRAAGVPIAVPLEDMPWGQRRFHLVAPEGTHVEVVQFLDPDPPGPAAGG